ncbi:sulfite exporter TauE/SafE family protein [bacterium]|nr:sulfite exporter TauE/SafE family protein [bacterium]
MERSIKQNSASRFSIAQIALFTAAGLVATLTWFSASNVAYEFVGLGLIGAIFANATGAGGGVVFIPTFHQLGLSESAAVATSFGIQTFGMTAGALAWLVKFSNKSEEPKGSLNLILLVCAIVFIPSVLGLYSVNLLEWSTPARFDAFFAWFSIVLGLCILATLWRFTRGQHLMVLSPLDVVLLILLGYIGGIVTAWLSVGVGEIIAFYLIARGFNPSVAIASAVVITALSVWSIAPMTFSADSMIAMHIVLAAGPAAVIGGLSARFLVDRLPQFWLKVFFGSWLILIGAVT